MDLRSKFCQSGFIYPFNFRSYIGAWLINNVLLVSGVQYSDSVIHIHVSIFFSSFVPILIVT